MRAVRRVKPRTNSEGVIFDFLTVTHFSLCLVSKWSSDKLLFIVQSWLLLKGISLILV